VRRVYECVSAGTEWPRELFGAEFESDMREVGVGAGVLRFDTTQKALSEYFRTFEDFHAEMEELIHADEERVVDMLRDGGRISGSDAEVSNRYFHVWIFGHGRIVGLSVHTDRNRALEAAGLRE
jgi:ketosteroid isomerase-like protein